MKICFVYEFGSEIWSTPSSLFKEFIANGWGVDRFHLTKDDPRKLIETDYDIILTMDWKGIDISPDTHKKIAKTTCKIRENADTPQNYNKHLPHCNNYNILLTPDYPSYLRYSNAGYKTIWFNHFADTNIHKIYHDTDNLPPVRSTRGYGGSQFMDTLTGIIPKKFENRNGLIGERYGSFLSGGKIVLQNSRWKEITRRIFEGMACGIMVLTDRLPSETNIDSLFKENENIVYYDTFADCISKINYYISDEGSVDREKIAKNGHSIVMSNHTQKHRYTEILKAYNEWKENFL
jgi:hypothetical protein